MQTVVSQAIKSLSGQVIMPGDKSMSHRALILGAIAEGTTEIHGFLSGLDCLATLKALAALGVDIQQDREYVRIHGVGLRGLRKPSSALDFSNSGTAMRLMTGLLCGQTFATTLIGDKSLSCRPMLRIADPLRQMGADIQLSEQNTPPIHITPVSVLQGINYRLELASAQIKSCLLLAGLYAQGETVLTGKIATRDHTERMMTLFSCSPTCDADGIRITGGKRLHGVSLTIPGDLSAAAFFLVAACLLPDSDVYIENVGINPTRDGLIHILQKMGGRIETFNQRTVGTEPVADIRARSSSLKGIKIPADLVANAIDEFPVLFIAAACAQGITELEGAAELQVKESDRIQVMADGLQACGIDAIPKPGGIKIHGGVIMGGEVHSHGDHRVAMAFLIAGAVSRNGIKVHDCTNIETSFPRFIDTAEALGFCFR